MVGNNEDSWRLTSRIWFEQGGKDKFGVAYVGYSDKNAGDGAVNEAGLAFDAFTMPQRENLKIYNSQKPWFSYQMLATIMQQCRNVDEVYAFLSRYSLAVLNGSPLFNGGMLWFIDKSGKYLSVEADTMIMGNESKYVLANFSVSGTPDFSTIKMERYCKGVAFLKNKLDTSLAFCTALSDTMHVSRKKLGDGTLYTSIYDLEQGKIYLYFFHDYKHLLSFDLKSELAKGDHSYALPSLFPVNAAYVRFSNFKTPQNNTIMFGFLVFSMLVFLFTSVCFFARIVVHFRKAEKPARRDSISRITMVLLPLLMFYYSYVLIRNQAVFYFPSPYHDIRFSLLNLAAYLPFLLLILIFPLVKANVYIFKKSSWKWFFKYLYLLNNILFVTLLLLFYYWGLFDVFS